ncbi:hypothetical protein E2986_08147 [Frieseomelitta varia]|uniref:Serine/threonine-protein kinase ATM n=1 Tax=Frieseomelitta varia TaxID=561572 RepID=A0A833SDV8_9HYME|nr:hypothetical protein E2986_08147 [Frieseomelitta varia]
MSRYLERIQTILKNADSKKITDKRKCVVDLLELYDNEEAILEICKNTERNERKESIIDWSYIIHIVHRILLNETDRLANKDTCNKTIVNMIPKHWEELLKICINLYKRMSSLTSKRAVLNALQMIIEYGCLYSNLSLNVEEILLFLESILLDVKLNEEILAESGYKLTNIICQQIAIEYRITLCHFSENILPNIISLKGSTEKYKLLLFFVKIHHPKGVHTICNGAYSYDWNKWHIILKSMYLMILKDLKADILIKSFLWLAAEVFKQIIENPNLIIEEKLFNEYDYIQPVKRRRIAAKISGPVDILIDNNPEEAWPMIQILTILLKRHPECLKSEDYPTFLKILVNLFTLSRKEENIMNNLYELAAVLLVSEKIYSIIDIENSNIYWDQIWDILLRSLNINQNEISTHKLTQLFIIHNKITNPNALLKLYLTNVIKWSIMSVRTLIVVCEHLPLPTDMTVFNTNVYSPAIDTNSVRSCLIKWILNIPWHKMATQIKIDELCLLLISITLKSKHQKQIKFSELNDINNLCDCLKNEQNTDTFCEHIEQYYLLLTYKKNIFSEESKEKNSEEKPKVNEHVLFMEDIVTYLMNSLHIIIENESGNDDLHIVIIKITIIGKVISMMKELNMVPKNIEELSLVQALKNYINFAYSSLEKLNSRSKYAYLLNVTKVLNILYETSYDADVAEIIVTSTTLDMLKNIFNLMNIEDNEIRRKYLDREVIQNQCDFCNNGTIRIQTTKALTLFCCINVEQKRSEIQVKLMNNLLKTDMYDLSHTVDSAMAITVLKSLLKYDKEELWQNHEELPLKNLLKLYLYNYQLDDLMNIIVQFNKLRSERRYGFLAHKEFVKCLSEIIYISPSHFYYTDTLNQMPIIEGILSSLNKIEKSIDKLIINNENNDKIKIDKKKVITASVSLMLAAIISTNGTFQCHALLTMLRFTIDKKVESQIISRSIDIMSNQMNYLDIMDENLSYLMTYWFNSKYSLHLFPWNLTRCKSEEQFYKTHSNIIALIKFQNLEISNVVSFCNSINLSFEETIENIFPQILSWLLYCISGNNENVSEELACKVFKKLISNENEFARTKKFSNLFRDKFEKILIFLIERLHDEDYLEEILGERISFAISDPPHFKKEIIITCLKYMEENFLIQKNSIQYVLVCNYPKLKQEYFNTLSMYIIKDVGYNLLHIIKLHDSILRKLACKYFYEFVTHILHVRSEQIKEILNFTVMTLTPIAQTEKMPITLEILKFLIIDQKEILCDAIEKLNSFPNVPIFLEIRKVHNDLKYKANKIYSLEQEIQHFLCTVADRDIHYSIEDITHLQIQLSTRKEELRELYDKLETFHGFSEDCTLSILHQLIYKLIKLTASSDINVSIEAVKCLGELGPTDLTSMIYFEKSHVKESSDLIEILSYKIITIMVQFLFQSDIEFRKISADILHVIFSSSWGQKLLNTKYMEHLKTVLNESQSILPLCYIQPFINNKHSKMSNIGVNYTKVYDIITPDNIIWTIQSDGSYTTWIVELTCSVLKCFTGFYSENLIPICTLSTEFYKHFMSKTSISSQKFTYCDHRIVRCIMQVSNNVLKLNYIYIAKAAKYCSAFFTAILYAEMSCETILNDYNKFQTSKIDYVYEISPEEGKVIQNILRDSYAKIGDFDAIDGTGSSHLQDHSSRIRHYVHTNKWDKVMLAQDVELSSGNMTVIKEMANGLYQSGLQYLLSNFISTMSNNGAKIDEDIQYECAWRLSNKTGIQDAIQNARTSIIKALRNISLESSKTIYEKLMHLQLINEIEELNFAKQDEYDKLLYKWQQQDVVNFNEFEYIEPILTQRTVMFQINNTLTNNEDIKSALFNTYLQISKIAADKDNLHCATRSLAILTKQKDIPSKIQDQLLYQESLLARLTKDLDIGRFLLRNLMQKKSLDASLRAQILRVYGDWMAETKSENPQIIIQNYYLKSIEINTLINTQDTETIKDLHDTQVALARFADNQFQQISSYINSPQFEHLKECVTYSGKGINVPSINEDKYIRSAMILNQRQNTNDVAELEHIQKERDNYLILALKYYLIVLQQSENYNLLIFRIIALWLDNIYQKEINDLLQENLNRIPSFKFIPLVPQLAAHMNDNFNEFSEKIYKIMQRCALEHPHHTLPVLLALKNLHGDYEYNTVKKNRILEPRVLGAQKLLQELTESNIISIIQEMEKLSHALVMLANLATTSSKCNPKLTELFLAGCTIKIPKNQNILKIKNFENIFVLTLTIDVRPLRNYNNVIGIAKYTESYETVGGINTPKKLTCIGTDGIHRYQLIKGKDDLRQDAVMQQVFNVMNTLLKSYKETKRRKLTIRTYKVVPLTQRSGILEWCNNTMPIITILIGSNTFPGLCKKYYPKDYTANNCKEKLAAVVKSSTDMKLKVFMDCCAHMHPVMHHFFSEKYLSPETWFERRLAYTRSIATTSMAGYILGLGDRHLSNILIDQTTAEVIHIDFGIAFEQGKVLPIPETIPFRLTRNIEVGMGVSGVEGTMRHCCEKTLTVLRDQRQIIITLLQVLIYDPLFKWTITPAKAHDIQSVRAINKTAERALLRIEQKLQGTEEGLASSVSGQVERLIQEAHDPINLCRLYCGWQPYL